MKMSATAMVLALATGGLVMAQEAPRRSDTSVAREAAGAAGYLPADHGLDPLRLLPPFPAASSPEHAADRAAYTQAVKHEGTPRWVRAAAEDAEPMTAKFGCALGAQLDPARAPAMVTLLRRVSGDASSLVDRAKAGFNRPRPFAGEPLATARLCLTGAARTTTASHASYPSGTGTGTWLFALVLADAAPDRAAALFSRARDLSQSRVICRVHYPTDLEAGRLLASAVYGRLTAEPAFRADLAAARIELAAARAATTAPPAGCPV